jgi:hypothetical protein
MRHFHDTQTGIVLKKSVSRDFFFFLVKRTTSNKLVKKIHHT